MTLRLPSQDEDSEPSPLLPRPPCLPRPRGRLLITENPAHRDRSLRPYNGVLRNRLERCFQARSIHCSSSGMVNVTDLSPRAGPFAVIRLTGFVASCTGDSGKIDVLSWREMKSSSLPVSAKNSIPTRVPGHAGLLRLLQNSQVIPSWHSNSQAATTPASTQSTSALSSLVTAFEQLLSLA